MTWLNQIHVGDLEPSEAELAYCAGVIDSDGTIGVKRSTYGMRVRGDCSQPAYSERISVKQVEPEAVDLLKRLFGGSRYKQDPSAKRGKPLHSWDIRDARAAACLRAILPYLRIKCAQAENCLQLRALKETSAKERVAVGRGHMGAARRSASLSAAMDATYRRAAELNRVGV